MYIVVREPQVGMKSSYIKPVVSFFDDSEDAEARKSYETICGMIGPVAMAKIPFDELWELANDGIKWEDIIEREECIIAFNRAFEDTFLDCKDNKDETENEGDSEDTWEDEKPVKALTFAGWFKKNEEFMSRYERAVIEVRNNFEGYGEVAYTTKPEKICILLQIFGGYEMNKVQITGDESGPCFRFVLGVDMGKKLDTRESWV